MKLLKKSFATWNHYWFREIPPHSLAAFRILFGFYFLIYFLRYFFDVELMFSNQGVYAPYLVSDMALPILLAWALYLLTLLVIIAFVAGHKTRIITPTLLILFLYYYFLDFAVRNTAFDRLNIIFLTILCFAKLDGVWTLKRAKADQHQKAFNVPMWPIRMITLQIAFLYFGAGLWKLISPSWHTGEMMKWTLIGPWGTGLAFYLVQLNPPQKFFDVLTWGVIIFELSMPFMLYSKRFQIYACLIGFFFHLSIACLLNVPEFMNCVCAYILFIDPSKVGIFGNAFIEKVGRGLIRLSQN